MKYKKKGNVKQRQNQQTPKFKNLPTKYVIRKNHDWKTEKLNWEKFKK